MPTAAIRGAIAAGFTMAALFVAPSLANAAQGFIINQTGLKAGPDEQFPTVVEIGAGVEVNVFGCFTNHSWCDISFQEDRGWVSGQDLEVLVQAKRVKVVEVTTVVVPVVTFQITTYWQAHYSTKPFFKERERYASININIEGGGKEKPGKTDTGGQASVTGKGKDTGKAATEEETATGGAKAGAEAKATAKEKTGPTKGEATGEAAVTKGKECPAGQKDCKPEASAGADGKSNAMGKTDAESAVSGEAATKPDKKGAPAAANAKDCKPGTAGCPKAGAGNGNGG